MSELGDDQYVRFTWRQDFDLSAISTVKMLIVPARSVWDDFFDDSNMTGNHTASYELQKVENGNFVTNISLKTNTYHFLFRTDDHCNQELKLSCGHHVTSLANGRKLNYVNVGSFDNILLNQKTDDGRSTDKQSESGELKNPVIDSRTSEPQQRVPGQRRKKHMFACCYLD